MSKFEVKVRAILSLEPHPNADKLEFALIEGYRTLVKKAGDLVAYIPEAAVLPEWILKSLGLWNVEENKGVCGGELGNRVRAVKLRGAISQGIAYPLNFLKFHPFDLGWFIRDKDMALWPVREDEDVAAVLGITKHFPQVPAELAGAVMPVGRHLFPAFDLEDIKKYPTIIQEGELVFITEKLHGLLTGVVLLPEKDAVDGKRFFVFGKGLGQDGLAFIDDAANKDNVYLKMAHKFNLESKLHLLADKLNETERPVFMIGETFGIGVQDLGYGEKPTYRAFALGVGYRSREVYFDYLTALSHAADMDIQWVPELYRGPFSTAMLAKIIIGKETLTGRGVHIREGGVVEPQVPREDLQIGRVALKAISPEYLVRSGHTTEFQ